MDGDVAPLEELAELAARHGCRLMVDEAHATGALGPGGRGSVAAAGLSGEVDVVVGTLGKALGSYGAYACAGRRAGRATCSTRARPFIFSTAPPPPSVAAAQAALGAARRATPALVERLRGNAAVLRAGARRRGARGRRRASQIVPVEVGDAGATMALCERALERGVFAQGIRPPTVPDGSSRLRFTVMATHTEVELRARRRDRRRRRPRARDRAAARRLRLARARRLSARDATGVFVTGTGTEVGKTVVAAAIARTLAADGRAGRRLQAGRDRSRRSRASPTTSCCAGPPAADQSDDEIAPYRYGPPASPHLAAELAGERIDPTRLRRRGRAAAAAAPTRSSARASAACWCRSRRATSSATSPSTSACRW